MDFSKALPRTERLSEVRARRGERGLATPLLETPDLRRNGFSCLEAPTFGARMDYLHINPMKHGLVKRVADWPHSTFHHLVEQGVYPKDWAGGDETALGSSD